MIHKHFLYFPFISLLKKAVTPIKGDMINKKGDVNKKGDINKKWDETMWTSQLRNDEAC